MDWWVVTPGYSHKGFYNSWVMDPGLLFASVVPKLPVIKGLHKTTDTVSPTDAVLNLSTTRRRRPRN